MSTQPELFDRPEAPSQREVDWLVAVLQGQGWVTATALLERCGVPANDNRKRRIRQLAQLSEGRIAGDQRGYKLVGEMTAEEFSHVEHWMRSQEEQMKLRRIQMQRVFYALTNIAPSAHPAGGTPAARFTGGTSAPTLNLAAA